MRTITFVCALALGACAIGQSRPPSPDRADASDFDPDASLDAWTATDASTMDSGVADSNVADASVELGTDAGRPGDPDSGFFDAATPDSHVTDAAPESVDSGPAEPPLDVPVGHSVIASAEFAVTEGVNGLGISDRFWVGWRFRIPEGETYDVHSIGFHNRSGSGTIFGAIVQLAGPNDEPDEFDLSGGDVIAGPSLATLPGGRGHVVVPLETMLPSGWYAVVFGTAAYGAAASGENVGPAFGHEPNPEEQTAFSVSQVSGSVFMQRAGARMFVIVHD